MTPKEFTFDAAYQPQVRAKRGTREIMLDVIIALLPALCVGVWQFGAQALIPLAVSIVSCVFFEWAYRKLMKKPDSIGDLSAVVTGILLAYTLPANCKWWLPIIGAFFAIVVVKQLYGGIGKNFLNPALAGRAFLLASYALFMTTWVVPGSLTSVIGADATTMATPLSYMKAGEALPQYFTYKSMFLGTMPGCLGEVSALALLIGGVYLLCRKVITWHIPVSFIGTVALLTLIFGSKNGGGYTHVEWMLDNLLSGGLLLGAFFMATDYSTSPVTAPGRIIYGVGCGALTVLIRVFGGFPEGVSFAILIMNCCAWMFDSSASAVRTSRPRRPLQRLRRKKQRRLLQMAEKTEKKSGGGQIIKLALVLFAVSAIMALALGLVNELTKDTIAMRAAETTKKAYANVLAADEYTEQADFENDGTITKLSTATTGGQQAGYVAEATFSGAQGMITMVVGLDDDYNCTGVYVTKHSETSGLGAKAADTNEGAWRDNLVGQGDGMKLAKDGGDITAISGATITSRAVVTEVQTVINAAKSLG